MKINKKELKNIQKYWAALNYLAVGQLYLKDNPLLKRKLNIEDVKDKVIGHWGTVPGQTMIYAHLNRIISKYNLNMIYITGPGHGGNAPRSGAYLDGALNEVDDKFSLNEEGMKNLFKTFSFPNGVSSHASPELPGSINEGGELGYSLAHAFGAALDNKDLIIATVIGDGEAETGPLQASLRVNKFLNPECDGTILPILHLNGFKINNYTLYGKMSNDELYYYFASLGYNPYIVSGNNLNNLNKNFANTLEKVVEDIKNIKLGKTNKYPFIVFKSLKGMTGPKEIVGTSDAHQIPFQVNDEESLEKLEKWLKYYKPEEIFDEKGRLSLELRDFLPLKKNTMSLNKHANGGLLLKDLMLPKINDYEFKFDNKGEAYASDMRELGNYLRDVFKLNSKNKNFRMFGPDEAMSNRLNHIFEYENKTWNLKINKNDKMLNENGRVLDSILSEHVCEGALEGYLLTGRHGIMHSYESFIRVVDSMTSQHFKWLKMCSELNWRSDISSLNYILTSHAWQQDHNGYTHQEPGFINHLMSKKTEFINVYFPVDANSLIACTDKVLKSKNKINAIIASKHDRPQWLSMKEASVLVKDGVSVINWASNEEKNPDIVLACCGDTPFLETIIAAKILNESMKDLKVKVVNVMNLVKFKNLSDEEFDNIFTKNKPVIFNFHGYSDVIYSTLYNRSNKNIKVYGYSENGTITTPFNMRVLNKIDRYNTILHVLENIKKENKELEKHCIDMLNKHNKYINENGIDLEEISNFKYN